MDSKVLSNQKKIFKSITNFFNPGFISSETIKKLSKKNILDFIFQKNLEKAWKKRKV